MDLTVFNAILTRVKARVLSIQPRHSVFVRALISALDVKVRSFHGVFNIGF